MRKIIVDKEVFEKFPGFNRGIIVIENLENKDAESEIQKMLDEQMQKRAGDGEGVLQSEFIKAWDDIYVKFGANPNKFPPSIKSLLKRVSKGGQIPFINSVVALFNIISLKYLIPCGGDDVDTIKGNLKLGIAKGDEDFTSLGSTELENPENGEVIYFDEVTNNVMCRRWNWRNGDFSKITTSTKKIVINVDGIGPANETLIVEARNELADLLTKYCGAKCQTDLLNSEKSEIEIAL
ncbi:MAG: phenylalanine--tRNA ligase beta subunit-related protein [Patescibacteria group bacterium]